MTYLHSLLPSACKQHISKFTIASRGFFPCESTAFLFDIVTLSSSSTGFLIIALNDRRVSPLGYWPYSAVSFARDVSCSTIVLVSLKERSQVK